MPIPEMWERSFTYLLMGVRSLSRHKIHPTLKCKGPKPLTLGMPLLPLLGILPHTCKGCNGWALYQWQRPYPWFRKWLAVPPPSQSGCWRMNFVELPSMDERSHYLPSPNATMLPPLIFVHPGKGTFMKLLHLHFQKQRTLFLIQYKLDKICYM